MYLSINSCYKNRSGETFLLLFISFKRGCFKLTCRTQRYYWWAKAVHSQWSALPPSGVLSGSTPPHTLKKREKENKLEEERERYRSPTCFPNTRLPIARPRVHTLSIPDPRSRSTNVSIGTALNYRNVSYLSSLTMRIDRRELLISPTGNLQSYFGNVSSRVHN